MKKSISGSLTVLILILFLTHPVLTRDGAAQGLRLWSRTVLPTLLPFMICSNVIAAAGGLPILMAPFRPICRTLFGLSDYGGYVLLSGLLCGYPMGAKTCREFLDQGRLSLPEARYLLAVSNHPSPMFVMGYLAPMLDPALSVPRILAALYLPVLPLSIAAGKIYGFPSRHRETGGSSHPERPDAPCPAGRRADRAAAGPGDSFDEILMRSIETMVRIGGYIMLFSILAAYIEEIPGLPATCRSLALGIAEITTGLRSLCHTLSGETQGLLCAAVTAFGGLSGIFQTGSVLRPLSAAAQGPANIPAPPTARPAASPHKKESPGPVPGTLPVSQPLVSQTYGNARLSLRHYVLWKLAHTIITCLLYSLPNILRFPVR